MKLVTFIRSGSEKEELGLQVFANPATIAQSLFIAGIFHGQRVFQRLLHRNRRTNKTAIGSNKQLHHGKAEKIRAKNRRNRYIPPLSDSFYSTLFLCKRLFFLP